MAINVPCCSSCRWSAKQYILAGLFGTQVAIAIAVVFSIVLSPAHVYFSVADAKIDLGGGDYNDDYFYNFTLVANNTSPHTAVRYGAINFEIWHSRTGWVPAEVETSNLLQPPQNITKIPVWAEYWQNDVANKSSPAGSCGCVVVIIAQVQFKIGPAFTRPYIVRVSCFNVDFNHTSCNTTLAPLRCTR